MKLCLDLENIKVRYYFKKRQLLEDNVHKVDWNNLSLNPSAIHILEHNVDKIDWNRLSGNYNGIYLLENNKAKINYAFLSDNRNYRLLTLIGDIDIYEYDYRGIIQKSISI